MNMKNKGLAALLLTVVLVFIMTPAVSVQAKVAQGKDSDCISPKMVQLKTDMQKVGSTTRFGQEAILSAPYPIDLIRRTCWTGYFGTSRT
jgi:hypothetical protein